MSTNEEILKLLHEITIELAVIKKDIKNLSNKGNRMDSHISNVENVYNNIRLPLSWMKNKVNYLMGCESTKNEELLITMDTTMDI